MPPPRVDEVIAVWSDVEASVGVDDPVVITDDANSLLSRIKSLEGAPNQEEILDRNVTRRVVAGLAAETRVTYSSAPRMWGRYCDMRQVMHFPAQSSEIERWLALMRNAKTARVYLSALLKGSRVAGFMPKLPLERVSDILSGVKATQPASNAKDPIPPSVLDKIPSICEDVSLRMLFVTAFVFLLRVKSECIPILRGDAADVPTTKIKVHSSMFLYRGELWLILRRRKNRPGGSVLRRGCTCGATPNAKVTAHGWWSFCPVHTIWPWVKSTCRPGGALFGQWSYQPVLARLKALAVEASDVKGGNFGTHSLRKGAADSIVSTSGNGLFELLQAGEWCSAAFRVYIQNCNLVNRALSAVAISDSEGD